MSETWIKKMMAIGVLSYREQENLYQIAKHCAKTVGKATAGAGFVLGAPGGPPTALAGALTGLYNGTLACTLINVAMRKEMKKLARGQESFDF